MGNQSRRTAVALDCEMVSVKGGGSELAKLCVVDLFTAEVLINKLVDPTNRVIDWRTRYSGIKVGEMAQAVRKNQALRGWKAARLELWRYVDRDTILVGHALHHDLQALHLIHLRVIDTSIVTRTAVSLTCRRSWSLKVLCAELANLVIQNHSSKGHDCLEDTLATREVLLRCVLYPQGLASWAGVKLAEEQERAKEREVAKAQREAAKAQRDKEAAVETAHSQQPQSRRQSIAEMDSPEMNSLESEMLHWSDVAEDLGWPHPDTGYDPWSD